MALPVHESVSTVAKLDAFPLPATNLAMKKESSELPKPTRRTSQNLVPRLRNRETVTTVGKEGVVKLRRTTSVAL